MDTANKQIEQQITVLLRRVQRIHLSTTTGDVEPRALRLRHHVQARRRGPAAARRARHRVRPRPLDDHPPGAGARGDRPRGPQDRPVRPSRVDPRPHRRAAASVARPHPRAPPARRLQRALADWPTSPTSTDFGRAPARSSTPPSTACRRARLPVPSSRRVSRLPLDVRPSSAARARGATRGTPRPGRSPPAGAAARLASTTGQSPASSAPSSYDGLRRRAGRAGHPAGRAEHRRRPTG